MAVPPLIIGPQGPYLNCRNSSRWVGGRRWDGSDRMGGSRSRTIKQSGSTGLMVEFCMLSPRMMLRRQKALLHEKYDNHQDFKTQKK